jgi:hypothetical protein
VIGALGRDWFLGNFLNDGLLDLFRDLRPSDTADDL